MKIEGNNEFVLVTGGTGFVGGHCILQLLQKGYRVKTTVRSLTKKDDVFNMLKACGITSFEHLQFIEADLSSDDNWNEAVSGCKYVLHVASPIGLSLPKTEDEMVRPAVDGTLRVLKAAREAGVKRVVMTSNFGAVGYSHKNPETLITEDSWTDPNEKGLSVYNKSKILAERAAWDFIKSEGGSLELTVINPVAIFGPSFSEKLSSGFELLKNIMDGIMKAIPKMELAIVDVRDLADLHIRAMESSAAKGQRFLALSGGVMTLPEIAQFLKRERPDATGNTSSKVLPDWLVRLTALFNDKAKAIAPMLGVNRKASNEKAKRILGWQPRSNEEALLASADCLVKYGVVKNNATNVVGKITTMILLALFLFATGNSYAQGTFQTVKGIVIDNQTQSPIESLTVNVVGTNKGTTTDSQGRFSITGVTPGRYDISFSFIGYNGYVAPNVEVTSGKEVVLDIGLEASTSSLQEVVIKSGPKKHETVNQLATVSGRESVQKLYFTFLFWHMKSFEEAKRRLISAYYF